MSHLWNSVNLIMGGVFCVYCTVWCGSSPTNSKRHILPSILISRILNPIAASPRTSCLLRKERDQFSLALSLVWPLVSGCPCLNACFGESAVEMCLYDRLRSSSLWKILSLETKYTR
ncbi:hypothetical protein Hamer_G020760 [Homarus americanus]|uniref:Uncharacterized protein n=1 Tax=Homarus americanus TaxID=6706 RepID=A0A8J5JXK9_HOMAM|nr:hypothetical protein Hamer_G020760 [Homarus americanus]